MQGNTQQLERRNTYTPTGAAPARGNCDLPLKVPRGKDGVAGLKTLSNNSEEHLTDLSMSGVLSRLARIKLLAPLRGKKAIIVERGRGRTEEVRRAIPLRAEARGLLAHN